MEKLISIKDYELLGYHYNQLNVNNKTLAALRFQEELKANNTKNISNETIENFRNLICYIREKAKELH